MTTYIFNEAGCIPGIPGTFAVCRVDVDEEGNITQRPLHIPAAQVEPPQEPAQESAPQEKPIETSDSPPLGG